MYADIKDKGEYSFQPVIWSGNTSPEGLSFLYLNDQFPFCVLPKTHLESMLHDKAVIQSHLCVLDQKTNLLLINLI